MEIVARVKENDQKTPILIAGYQYKISVGRDACRIEIDRKCR